ncbi:hypothetical protein [Methanoeremita antiquus]|nr:hypothetical protein [Methanomicrobium antiquum]
MDVRGAFDAGGKVVIHVSCGDIAGVDIKGLILTVYGGWPRTC